MPDVVIILGAPRSGTNMLRDVLASMPGFATWPCDEINLMWKHGNRAVPSDELTPGQATSRVRTYLHRKFDALARRSGGKAVVEKTCANSLRVAFTAAVFPDARFIFIRRDGIDAAASAAKRWNAAFDWRYTARKMRYAPPIDLLHYGSQALRARIPALTPLDPASDGALPRWWGPRPADFRHLLQHHPIDELAMIQWQRCVASSRQGLADLPPHQVHEVAYEQFVSNPGAQLARIKAFLGQNELVTDSAAVSAVSGASVGRGRNSLDGETIRRLTNLGQPTLGQLGYA